MILDGADELVNLLGHGHVDGSLTKQASNGWVSTGRQQHPKDGWMTAKTSHVHSRHAIAVTTVGIGSSRQ